MADNIFETLKLRKDKLRSLIEKASLFGWIDEKRKTEMLNKIDSDTLTIGVIGQMKCGKSTFLNSFVFANTILPSATTPMTAALSVITYGERERIIAEFYTPDEWAEQQMQASRSIEDAQGNLVEESKIKAAKELVNKAHKLGTNLNQLLGKTQEDEFCNLIEYVGADGKYVSITKAVTIYYPKEYLKGVQIVDTPGFNDPIVSREERTKEFLKKADVVLMMLYAGRPFDATDREIIFQNVAHCGIGKVLIGINKYDIPYCSDINPESEEDIRKYVVDEIKKACAAKENNTLYEILEETTPIPLSAEMALLAQLPMSRIKEDETLSFSWNRHCQNFGISTQKEMYERSHMTTLADAVTNLVIKDKDEIIFAKPINAIIAAGAQRSSSVNENIQSTKSEIENWQLPDDEIKQKEENLRTAHRKLSKKISTLGGDIEFEMKRIVRKGKDSLEDEVDSACKNMRTIVETEWKRFTKFKSKIQPKLDAELAKLSTRTLKRSVDSLAENAKRAIDRCVSEFFAESEETLMKHLPEFDSREFIKDVQKKIDVEVSEKDLFSIVKEETEEEYGISNLIYDFMNGASYGLLGIANRALSYEDEKIEVLNSINSISCDFDPEPYLEAVMSRKNKIIDTVKSRFLDELITPLQDQLGEIKKNKDDKESRLNTAKERLLSLQEEKEEIKKQIEEIELLKKELA